MSYCISVPMSCCISVPMSYCISVPMSYCILCPCCALVQEQNQNSRSSHRVLEDIQHPRPPCYHMVLHSGDDASAGKPSCLLALSSQVVDSAPRSSILRSYPPQNRTAPRTSRRKQAQAKHSGQSTCHSYTDIYNHNNHQNQQTHLLKMHWQQYHERQ